MKTNDINIRDPFVLPFEGKYYMYGSRVGEQLGFDVYISDDLENWDKSESVFEIFDGFWATTDCWAPEVHFYNGKFYMFASFKAPNHTRATQILVSDMPDGKFKPHSNIITPNDWECLDGTFYVEEGTPYMVFCHEWVQVNNGEVWAVELEKDLTKSKGEPFLLWNAKEAPWTVHITNNTENFVTDGPFFFYDKNGCLCAIWSSFGNEGYATGVVCSDNGKIHGKWKHKDETVFKKDGGHAMIFNTFNGKRMISLHTPNSLFNERPHFFEFDW